MNAKLNDTIERLESKNDGLEAELRRYREMESHSSERDADIEEKVNRLENELKSIAANKRHDDPPDYDQTQDRTAIQPDTAGP